jgi:hypothetical protein
VACWAPASPGGLATAALTPAAPAATPVRKALRRLIRAGALPDASGCITILLYRCAPWRAQDDPDGRPISP